MVDTAGGAYLKILRMPRLLFLQVHEPGNEFENLITLERRVLISADVLSCTDLADQTFTVQDAFFLILS